VSYDFVVIGAGASGLSAARSLSGAGKRVCLLEARNRIGGRIFSLHLNDLPVPIELGAEFIHGQQETTFDIVDAASLGACEIPDDHWWSQNGDWMHIEDYWGRIDQVRAKIGRRTRDLSFDTFLRSRHDLPPRLRELAHTFVEGYHAAHADRMSTLALRSADGEQDASLNRQFRLTTGQDALLAWLRAGLDPQRVDLRLGTPATLVQWVPRSVTVQTQRGERIRASALVVTIPIGVWKAPSDQDGAIRFDPPLDTKMRALEKIEAGHVVKIAFRFRERFWEGKDFGRQPFTFVHTRDRFLPTWWTTAPVRSPILVGWAGGHAADALLAEGADALADRALDALASSFRVPRKRLESMVAGSFTHDWQRDPYSRCAYSYAAVGGHLAHATLAKPIRKTLFFAGEATSGDQTGTVAGAIESGIRAAREALRT
jgi:monoamine oxidase